jgi:hypothetical protein
MRKVPQLLIRGSQVRILPGALGAEYAAAQEKRAAVLVHSDHGGGLSISVLLARDGYSLRRITQRAQADCPVFGSIARERRLRMTTSREDRFIENERLFRSANERLHDRVEDIVEPDQSIPFLCECIDDTCTARIDLKPDEYEKARSEDEWFVIAPGHPRLEGERIVDVDERFVIVSKEDVG